MMVSTSINNRFFCLLLVISLVSAPSYGRGKQKEYGYNAAQVRMETFKDIVVTSAGIGVTAISCYLFARLCSAGIFSAAQYRYEAELDLLLRATFNEQLLQEELIPFILEQHDRNNSLYFFMQGKYKNYPLLYYKNNLDWYIRRLWLSKILYGNAKKRNQIDVLQKKLERLRRLIVTDYRFVQEQRDFDKQK